MTASLSIGLVAYGVNPAMVFVRVPNERGRYVLTDRCVVEVACPHCDAMIGEPCRRSGSFGRPVGYGVGTHWKRRDAWQMVKHRHPWRESPKPRIAAEDFAAAQGEPE
jgi:hypothetical protein